MPNEWTDTLSNLRRRLQGKPARAQPHERVGRYALEIVNRDEQLANATTELERLFWSHDGRLVHKWPHYLPIHQRYLEPFKPGFRAVDGIWRPL